VRRETQHRKRHAGFVTALACIGLAALAGLAQAQPVQPQGSKYYVWGQVGGPGAYLFVASPDILELISAAGGPTRDANLKRVILIRAVTQTRTRINLEEMLNKGQVVRLSPGDVVIVPSTAWYSFRDGLAVATTLVSAVTLIITVLNWRRVI
jgi:protein involved in polysaccharide export with SLBB domain